ncbi:MAG: alpha/beta fold hydrolase [Mycobacteriales bacterium]
MSTTTLTRRPHAGTYDWLVRDLGDPTSTSTPVMFVAGLGSGDYLLPHAELLARTRRVLLPDMPGFGHSRGPARLRSVEEFAAALGALLRHEVGAPADVIGNSFGTQIALALAESEPDAVRRLVLIGPTMDRAARTYPKVLGRWLRTAPIEPPSLTVSLIHSYLLCGVRTPALAFRASMRDRPEQRISKIPHEVLLVRGMRDRIAPRSWLEELQGNASRAEIAEVPDTAHTVDYAAPKQVAPIVTEFLDRD